ncbi:hypothetical protein Adt_08875 [Abeliophyllum distichum]|uniref:Uncharacterized protein n=1 Tax=Abeliophyllum distichum TaxID=126358 RepID=A0ABD1UFR8_9LAMI
MGLLRVDGRLKYPNWVIGNQGDPSPEEEQPTCRFQEEGIYFTLLNCSWRKEVIILFMELEPSNRLRELAEVVVAGIIGDIDSDSTGGETYSGEDMKASRCSEPLLDAGQASERRKQTLGTHYQNNGTFWDSSGWLFRRDGHTDTLSSHATSHMSTSSP